MTIPATSMAWIRTTVPVLVLTSWMLWQRIPFFRGNYKRMLLGSVFNASRMYLFFVAYILTTISNAVIVMYIWPVFVTVLSAYFLKEEITRRQIFLLMISMAGVVVVYSGHEFSIQNNDFVGLTAAVFSALIFAMSVIVFKSEIQNYSRPEVIFYQNVVGPLVFLPFFMVNPFPTPLDWALGTTHGVVIGLIMFGCFFYGLSKLKASTTAMVSYLEIISAVTLSVVFLDEELTLNMIIGGLLIISSTALLRLE